MIATLVFSYAIVRLIQAYAQLWWLPLGLTVSLFGIFNSLIDSPVWISGYLAPKITNKHIILLSLLTAAISLLLTTRNLYAVTAAMIILLLTALTFSIAFTEKLNQNLSSEVRAGAISVVGLISNISAIAIVFIFGYISNATNIFNASWIAVATTAIMTFCVYKTLKTENQQPLNAK